AFSQKELEDLKALFVSLAAQSQSNGQYTSPPVFKVSLFSFALFKFFSHFQIKQL
ncbi:hypothetical protein U1Q18_042710, partial [Sarracenia purpurea var. burkii]